MGEGEAPLPSASKPRMCPSKVIVGKALVALGLGMIAVALSIQLIIKKEMPGRVREFCVVDSSDHPELKGWRTNNHDKANPRYYKYMFHTITNKDAVLQGEAPIFEERGPYVFAHRYKKVGVTFEDDGDLVTYRNVLHNTFVPELSVGGEDDEVTIVNIGWAQFTESWKSETMTVEAGGGMTMLRFRNSFYNSIVKVAKLDSLRRAMNEAHFGVNFALLGLKFPANAFFEAWGGNCINNGDPLVPPFCGLSEAGRLLATAKLMPDDKQRMARLAGVLLDSGLTKDPISAEASAALWNEADEYSIISFVEHNPSRSKFGTMFGVGWWTEAATNETICNFLSDHFKIKPTQVKTISQRMSDNKESKLLLEELIFRFTQSKLNLEERAILEAQIKSTEDLMLRQLYAGDVVNVLTHDPNAQLRTTANLEFSTFTKTKLGMLYWETGLTQDNIKCLLDWAAKNRTEYDIRITQVVKPDIGKMPVFTNDLALWSTPEVPFEVCFPNQQTIDVAKMYTDYLVNELMVPTYKELTAKEGLLVTNTVGKWVLGTGPMTFLDLALDEGDPRISFSLLGTDPPLRPYDQPDEDALCHQASDPYNIFTACEWNRDTPTSKVYYRRANHTMYTGKKDIQKMGQYKRFTNKEVLHGVWAKDVPIEGGAYSVMDPTRGLRPLVQGHTDGTALPPYLLENLSQEELKSSYISVLLDCLSAPMPFVYEKKTTHEGITVHRFVLHKDAFTAHRYDAASFGMGAPDAPPEMLEVFNLTYARESPLYLASRSISPKAQLANHKDGNLRTFTPYLDQASTEQDYAPSYLDVEPITGKTVAINLGLRTFVTTLDQYVTYDFFHPTIHRTPLFPIFDLTISVTASDAQKIQLKSQIYDLKKYSSLGSVIGYVVGGSCFLIGLAYWLAGSKLARAKTLEKDGLPSQ